MRVTLEDFELGATLGVGTVGTVYRAIEKKSGQAVAIKILQQSVSEDALVRARFRREVAILQRVHHPNIIGFYAYGESDGQLFCVMELVEGGSVKDLLKQFERLTWQEVVTCARQVCSALQYAHNNGIIHRDLKPGNLFLTPEGVLKLGDFGIARDTHSADLTLQGFTVGTHAYMSPEQIVGDDNITGKADLYSLGCVLFEMLTGFTPFHGSNFVQLFEKHLRQTPPHVRDFLGDCPAELDRIIFQMLEKDPEARPFNARAVQAVMMQILDHYQNGKEVKEVKQVEETTAPTPEKSRDVGASDTVDAGQDRLSRRIRSQQSVERETSWRPIVMLAVLSLLLVAIAVLIQRVTS